MKKWIFMTIVALTAMFAMVGCPTDDSGDSDPAQITITFGNAALGDISLYDAPAPDASVKIDKGSSLGSKLPSRSNTGGLKFAGWFVGSKKIDKDTKFSANTTVNATWYKTNSSGQLINDDNTVVTDGSGNPITESDIEAITPGEELPVEPEPVPPPGEERTVSFNYDYDGAPTPPASVTLSGSSFEDDQVPFPSATRAGWYFAGWYSGRSGAGTKITAASSIPMSVTLYAWWINDTLTVTQDDHSSDAELFYLTNGAVGLYQFEIPNGKTLADFEAVTYEVKVTAATKYILQQEGTRYIRLYGVYKDGVNVTTEPLGDGEIKILNSNQYNDQYILHSGLTASSVASALKADDWTTIELAIRGNSGSTHNAANAADATKTGKVYFGVGISCQRIGGGTQFIQMIKDVKLVGTTGGEVEGIKPVQAVPVFPKQKYEVAQLVSYVDPILLAWRGSIGYANTWRDVVPHVSGGGSDRGTPPNPGSLTKVALMKNADDWTYVHTGDNLWNQRGWASFEEAGRANDQDYTGDPSSVVFDNFRKAWYLDVHTTSKPSGTVTLVWMGGYGGWNANDTTNNDGSEKVADGSPTDIPMAEIIENGSDNFTIRFLLPEALATYSAYYSNNTVWAALALSYWGGGNTARPGAPTNHQKNIWDLGVTGADLLLESADVEGPATGISLAIPFTLSNPPAGGNLIADVLWNGVTDQLIVKAASGLSAHRWFIDGTEDGSSSGSGTLTINNVEAGTKKYTITVQAQDTNGKWKSQAVYFTLKN